MELLQNIREVLRMLSRRKPAKIRCPVCGSSRIRPSSSSDYWLTPKKYACEECRYVGPLVMELEKEET